MNHPTEPAAEFRSLAAIYWQMYVALTAEGFSETQALIILGQVIAAAQQS